MKIAALYTCFNRKAKTLSSIKSLFESLDDYNNKATESIDIEVFLTDDGCSDGTAAAIRETFPNRVIHILQGNGNLYWAGGMRLAWNEALIRHKEWQYYLLLNDDTLILNRCIMEILSAEAYSKKTYNREGIISGITCSSSDPEIITYGGDVIVNRLTGKTIRLGKSKTPRLVDMTNANILLVPSAVVDEIGTFCKGYIHSTADVDYSMWARRHKIPVLITSEACGVCENDHHDADVDYQRIIKMTRAERKSYYNNPLHSSRDYLTFVKRNMPLRYPLSWFFSIMKINIPGLYFFINKHKLNS